MDVINTTMTLIGVFLGAAFVVAGGILIPLWNIVEENDRPDRRRP